MLSHLRTVDLAGVVIDLAAETSQQATCLDWHFGRLSNGDRNADLRIELRRAACPHPERPPSMHDGPIKRWELSSSLRLWHELGAGATLTEGLLVIGGEPAPDQQWRVARQLLFSALSWYLDRQHLIVLHAAMVGRDGDAALLLGGTGRGKSTVAVAAFLDGWELLSDDLVVVRADPAGPIAFGIPKRVSVGPELVGQLDALLEPLPGDDRARVMLPASSLTIGWRRVRTLVRVDHHDRDGGVRRLSHHEALHSTVAAFVEAERPASLRRHLGCLAALAGGPAFELALSQHADQRLSRATEALHRLWHTRT